jgi:hypothetical protein
MIRMAILLLSLTAIAQPADDELVLRWNQFAKDANEYLHSIDANAAHRLKQKEKLEEEWRKVYPLL